MVTGIECEIVERRPNESLLVGVPQLILTNRLVLVPRDDVGSRLTLAALDVEHLAVHLADDKEVSSAYVTHLRQFNATSNIPPALQYSR